MKSVFVLLVLFLLACSSNVEVSENSSVIVQNESSEKSLKDLSIEIVTDSAYPDKDSQVEFKVLIKNEGFKTINQVIDFSVVFENYSFSNSMEVNLVPATDVVAHEFNYTLTQYGTFTANAEVDTKNALNELDETNNKDSLKIYVKEKFVEEPEEDSPSNSDGCSDSDYGKKTSVVGTCTDASFPKGRTDFCADDESLAELYCKSERCQIEVIECDNACINGKCY